MVEDKQIFFKMVDFSKINFLIIKDFKEIINKEELKIIKDKELVIFMLFFYLLYYYFLIVLVMKKLYIVY